LQACQMVFGQQVKVSMEIEVAGSITVLPMSL